MCPTVNVEVPAFIGPVVDSIAYVKNYEIMKVITVRGFCDFNVANGENKTLLKDTCQALLDCKLLTCLPHTLHVKITSFYQICGTG
jgi:hypothetical protein